jgi:hypothetical protein
MMYTLIPMPVSCCQRTEQVLAPAVDLVASGAVVVCVVRGVPRAVLEGSAVVAAQVVVPVGLETLATQAQRASVAVPGKMEPMAATAVWDRLVSSATTTQPLDLGATTRLVASLVSVVTARLVALPGHLMVVTVVMVVPMLEHLAVQVISETPGAMATI